MRTAVLLWLVASAICVRPAAAQARVEAVGPDSATVSVDLLGTLETVAAEPGLLLEVGDMITGRGEGVTVTLSCPPGSDATHILTGPFRVIVAEPETTTCAIDLLAGQDDVLTEEPTEVNSAGIALENVGTQYRVEVRRTPEEGLVRDVAVYDGEVRVSSGGSDVVLRTNAAASLTRSPDPEAGPVVATRAIRPREVRSSALAYARYTVGRADPGTVEASPGAVNRIVRLQARVLTAPEDTVARVDLAKAQLDLGVGDAAMYNLRRVGVVEAEQLRRYQIDPGVLSRGLSPSNRRYFDARVGVLTPATRRPDLVVRIEGPTRAAAGQDIGPNLRITVENAGSAEAPGTEDGEGYMVDLVLSRDEALPDGFSGFYPSFREDVLLRGGRISNTPTVPAGRSVQMRAGAAILPADTPPGRYCLGARVDAGNVVTEADESNNSACHTLQVVGRRGEGPAEPRSLYGGARRPFTP